MKKVLLVFGIVATLLLVNFMFSLVDDNPNNDLIKLSTDEIKLQVISPIDYSVIKELRDSEIYTTTTFFGSLYNYDPLKLALPSEVHSIAYYVTSILDDGTIKNYSSDELVYRHQFESNSVPLELSNNGINYLTVYGYNDKDICIERATFVLINHHKHFEH